MPTVSALDSLERVTFKKDQLLFEEGDASYFFYIIEKGEVDVFFPASSSKKEVHLATVGPGQPLGEFALIAKKGRSASARARTNGTAIKVSEEGYQSLLQDLPTWVVGILESFVNRLLLADQKLRQMKSGEATSTLIEIETILTKYQRKI